MNRRSIVQMVAVGSLYGATTWILPQGASAGPAAEKIAKNRLAGGVFYTKEAPGRWSKKAGSHAPSISHTESGIEIFTDHPMKSGEHWIVKHVLLDHRFRFIAETVFDAERDTKARSTYNHRTTGTLYALSVCNKHDTWMTPLEGA